MLVAEARSYGLAVLMSDRVNAVDSLFSSVPMVPFDAPCGHGKRCYIHCRLGLIYRAK